MKLMLLLLQIVINTVCASTTIKLDELMTGYQKWKIDIASTYSHTEDSMVMSSNELIMLDNGQYIPLTIPYEQDTVVDTLTTMIGLKYGVLDSTEIYLNMTMQAMWTQSRVQTNLEIEKDLIFKTYSIGLNQLLWEESWHPSTYVYFEAVPMENIFYTTNKYKPSYWNTYALGVLSYKSIDPIVFGLSIGYQLKQKVKNGSFDRKEGDSITLNPTIYFVINDEITLNWGATLSFMSASYENNEISSLESRELQLEMGMGYMLNYDWTVNIGITMESQSYSLLLQSTYCL